YPLYYTTIFRSLTMSYGGVRWSMNNRIIKPGLFRNSTTRYLRTTVSSPYDGQSAMVVCFSTQHRRVVKHCGDYIFGVILFRPGLQKSRSISCGRNKAGFGDCHYRMVISLPWE